LGKYIAALKDYNRALEVGSSEDFITYNNRGSLYADLGRYEDALTDFENAIDIAPDYAGSYYNRGKMYLHLDRTNEAERDFEKALELNLTADQRHQVEKALKKTGGYQP
jgi:tetratricopeptide (TPR) repeat protein